MKGSDVELALAAAYFGLLLITVGFNDFIIDDWILEENNTEEIPIQEYSSVIDFTENLFEYQEPLSSNDQDINRTILEACSCGIPVVSTEAGAVKKYIDEEWIIPYKNDEEYLIKEFKKKLKKFENNPDLLTNVGEKNRKNALKYDWKIVSKKWLKIVDKTYNQIRK